MRDGELAKAFGQRIVEGVRQIPLYDMEEVTRLCLVAMLTDGHVLLEGAPGMGKTALVRALGEVLHFPFGRIQFTPDLMPSDILGTYMPDPTEGMQGALHFQEGPIFTSLLLADEINRATPKTQSAMLEAMAERQVTIIGEKEARPLPPPFFVMATQNPIDHEGTYSLPEAQADRFMFKILVPSPTPTTLQEIVDKNVRELEKARDGRVTRKQRLREPDPEMLRELNDHRNGIANCKVNDRLPIHIQNMYVAAEQRLDELVEVSRDNRQKLEQLVSGVVSYGFGPRGAIALQLGSLAWAYLGFSDSRGRVADGEAMAHIVLPTLRHRLKLAFGWERKFCGLERAWIEKEPRKGFGLKRNNHELELLEALCAQEQEYATTSPKLLNRYLARFCRLTAPRPQDSAYADKLDETLRVLLASSANRDE